MMILEKGDVRLELDSVSLEEIFYLLKDIYSKQKSILPIKLLVAKLCNGILVRWQEDKEKIDIRDAYRDEEK